MARLGISTGSAANDGTGDSLLVAGQKINSNFNELYNYCGTGTTLNFGVWESDFSTSSNVGIGTTAKSDYSLYVEGDQYITGNISVGGTITYEDVTNVDAVGIITANSGIHVSGIVTAKVGSAVTYYGDGSYLTGIDNSTWDNVTTGITTLSSVGIGTTAAYAKLWVQGDSRITGILTIGNSSITINPNSKIISGIDEIIIGTGTTVSIKQSSNGQIDFIGPDGNPTSVGIGTTVSINTSGIITASNFSGDGSGLTGVIATGSGVVIKDSDTLVGVAATVNFGSNLTVSSLSAGIVTVTSSDSGMTDIVSDTTPQLGGNLDINSKHITGTGGVSIIGVVTATDFNSSSDAILKENIETVSDSLFKITNLRGVSFNWKQSGNPSYGVVAQELEEIFPELVGNDSYDLKTVNYNGIISVLIEAVKELSLKTKLLESKINKLNNK